MQSLQISYIVVKAHANQYPFQAEVGVFKLLSPLEQYINCKNFYGHNICIL